VRAVVVAVVVTGRVGGVVVLTVRMVVTGFGFLTGTVCVRRLLWLFLFVM
jgi:hypothetical protein